MCILLQQTKEKTGLLEISPYDHLATSLLSLLFLLLLLLLLLLIVIILIITFSIINVSINFYQYFTI